MIRIITEHNKNQIQKTFQQEIPKVRKYHPIARLQVALIVGNNLVDETMLHGVNINGDSDIWDTGWFCDRIQKQIHAHFKQNNHDNKFMFQWETLKNIPDNDEGWMRWNLSLYADRIIFAKQARYPGVQLAEKSDDCVISTELTSLRFQQRMINKIDKITKHVLMKYDDVDHLDKIRLLKTFIMPVTEVFAQILPMKYPKSVNNSIMNSYALACGIHPKQVLCVNA